MHRLKTQVGVARALERNAAARRLSVIRGAGISTAAPLRLPPARGLVAKAMRLLAGRFYRRVAAMDLRPETVFGPMAEVNDRRRAIAVLREPQNRNAFGQHARASNDLRTRLFSMVTDDPKRRKFAFSLLGQIEEWRLEHGRPAGEPRHPDVASGEPWPPKRPWSLVSRPGRAKWDSVRSRPSDCLDGPGIADSVDRNIGTRCDDGG